jgi:hypothetical protein
MDQLENGRKAVRALTIFWRKVASCKKGLEVRRQKQIVGPAARAGQKPPREHIGLVDVGALFAVHFDVDEPPVHQRGDGGV